ncbi:MAG: SDR family NAD(P)-dependent oxidoreductase [Polyangiaceae bacterium]|nr:SDR family NAD(P)-dependent oxidoreductase [Polyangiaceae bacterium]
MSKVWLITGCSRGLGRELAKAVLESGDKLVATARHPEQLRDIIEPHGNRAIARQLDVTKPAAARAAVAAATSAFGRLDVLVNNAGYANTNSIEDVSEEDFRAQFETNFFGAFHVTRAALPVFRNQKSGHVVQISSIGGRQGTAGLGAYQSAKWALEGLSEVLAREVAPLGIHVTLVEPGGFKTDWGGSSMRVEKPSAAYEQTVGAMAKHREDGGTMRGDPEKAAQAILQIASHPNPPLRLLLGTDAVFLAGVIASARQAEDEKWRALSRSTDFTGLPDFAETPIAKELLAQRNGR